MITIRQTFLKNGVVVYRENKDHPSDAQFTMTLCPKCGEAYEAEYPHVCEAINSYPIEDTEGGNRND